MDRNTIKFENENYDAPRWEPSEQDIADVCGALPCSSAFGVHQHMNGRLSVSRCHQILQLLRSEGKVKFNDGWVLK